MSYLSLENFTINYCAGSMVDYCELGGNRSEIGHISEIVCDGTEVNITVCKFSVVNSEVMISHPVAVQCKQGQ